MIKSLSQRSLAALTVIAFLAFALIPAQTFAAITAVQASANTGGSSAGSNFTLTSPTGTAAGDVLIVCIGERDTVNRVTAVDDGSGHSMTRINYGQAASAAIDLWYRVVASGDGTTWTVTSTANTEAAIMAYRGVDTINPINASSTLTAGTVSPAVVAAVTSTVPNTWEVACMAANVATSNNITTTSPSLTERADAGNGGGNTVKQAIWLGDQTIATAGSSGTVSITLPSNLNTGTRALALTPSATIATSKHAAVYDKSAKLYLKGARAYIN